MVIETPANVDSDAERDALLASVQRKVLWLAMQMVHHANNVRPKRDEAKVGGHQASSASLVTIMTSLYFDFLRAGDRVSVKPHASPVFHAIQYLLGNLDQKYLKTLRAFHGLQAYPSRTKDPDAVDFSTGSVGLGAVAPNFAALVAAYTQGRFRPEESNGGRYISLLGDAELDEGSIWEAVAEPFTSDLGNVLWIIDLNRQSLDRVIPGIRVRAWRDMFAANGWHVIDAKYGARLHAAFAEPNGELLRSAIDDMSNQTYQRLLRLSPPQLREWLPQSSSHPKDLARFISKWDDQELQDLFRNLGGHDFSTLREACQQSENSDSPTVLFAYTLKGWSLPSVGDPQNHSVVLSDQQMEELREQLEIGQDQTWTLFDEDSPEGRLCAKTQASLAVAEESEADATSYPVPREFGRPFRGKMSTQQIFGLILTDISRHEGEFVNRVVTVSPDVASSTNLGGWINKVGVWTRTEHEPLPDEGFVRALRWEETTRGQHIELGISENNLFMMLGQLGLSHEMDGEILFPIGTVYDPFVRRGLDAFFYSVYAGAKFIVVGTPSGVTLAPEGGAHQSMITQSIGVEMPELAFYEPCFGQELEWLLLAALEDIRIRKQSSYFRLTSKRVDQGLLKLPDEPGERERLRTQVLAGAYRLVDRRSHSGYEPGTNVVNVMACGAIVPEAMEASDKLLEEGVFANVINVTGPGPLYRQFQRCVRDVMAAKSETNSFMMDVLPPGERRVPVVTVADGHPHNLAWIGSALGAPALSLGVVGFGQSGDMQSLYEEYGIDVESIMAACFGALEM